MKTRKYLTAGEVASALGISKQTLVKYEKFGIFPKARRNNLNGWREYTREDVEILKKIMGRT
ncbi:MAG: MerR family transcriptional regulator [Elusimicrobia bacterium]|nr:MerR family transcriptional regulator [Elusimicrobiota bacterium]